MQRLTIRGGEVERWRDGGTRTETLGMKRFQLMPWKACGNFGRQRIICKIGRQLWNEGWLDSLLEDLDCRLWINVEGLGYVYRRLGEPRAHALSLESAIVTYLISFRIFSSFRVLDLSVHSPHVILHYLFACARRYFAKSNASLLISVSSSDVPRS